METHIRPYLSQYSESLTDEVLAEYLQEMVELHHDSNSFLDRAMAACTAIKGLECRGSTALVLVQLLSCSESVGNEAQLVELKQLLEDCLQQLSTSPQTDHVEKLQKELAQQIKLLKLRRLLLRYGIRRFEVADPQQASALVLHIVAQVETGTFQPLNDALEVDRQCGQCG